jgi:type IV pilus assembly protein PilC
MTTTYAYKVRDKVGKLVEGQLDAEDEHLVVGKLRSMGYVPIAIDRVDTNALQKELHIPGLSGRIKQKDVAVMSRQFATMINSGLPLLRSLSILSEQIENKALADTLTAVRNDVERGSSLSAAMAKHPKAFSTLYVSMVKSGEVGGVLDSVLKRLADTLEKQVELRRKIKSAMSYPVVVFSLVVLIVSGMMLFIVPQFQTLYKSLGGSLPMFTQVLITASDLFKSYLLIWMICWAAAFVAFRRWIHSEKGRPVWDRMKLKAPVFGKLVRKVALARFSRTLAALTRSGVPILESLEIVADTSGNEVVAVAVRDTQQAVKTGEGLARPLMTHEVFPPMVTQMIAVGEETGALDEMLDKIADFYDAEVEATVDALTSLIEPLLIVVMGVTVGFMVIALYMPMFNIITLIK